MSSLFTDSLFDNLNSVNFNEEINSEDDRDMLIDFDYFNEYYFNNY